MTEYKKPRDAASQALIDLRVKMGKTQASFAVEVLKTAVTTIARYETSHRPPGEVLLRLSEIAREHDPELSDKFKIFYLEDVLKAAGNSVTMIRESDSGEPAHGYLTTGLAGMDAIYGAVAFLKVIEKLRDPDPKQQKRALSALAVLDEAADIHPLGKTVMAAGMRVSREPRKK